MRSEQSKRVNTDEDARVREVSSVFLTYKKLR